MSDAIFHPLEGYSTEEKYDENNIGIDCRNVNDFGILGDSFYYA